MSSTVRSLSLLAVSAFLLAGCPDPTATTDVAATNANGAPSTPPPPGDAGAGAAGTPASAPAGAGRPTPPGFTVKPGEGVKLSGTLAYTGSKTGTIRVDFLKPPVNGALPELLDSIELGSVGEWSVEAPKNAGDLAVVAYIDGASDGPSAGDPAGRITGVVTVKEAPVTGLDITLSDEPDLGDLKPGQPGAQPSAAPPPVDPGAAAPTPATPPTGAPGTPSAPEKPADGAAAEKPAEGAAPAEKPADAPKPG